MKKIIYISGILGGLLLLFRLLGVFMEFPFNSLLLYSGLVLLVLVCLPLTIAEKQRQNKKIDEIIKSYKGKKKKKTEFKRGDSKTKGWDMNNSPFRERRSGLTWGGGNVKGANASRGNKRSFLK
jgi:hypothetical protein